MYYFFVVLYGLSLSEAYNIKVSGQVELGKQLSKLFREAYYELGGTVDSADSSAEERVKNYKEKVSLDLSTPNPDDPATSGKTTTHKHKKNDPECSQEESSRISVLDEMVQNEQRNLHLYGNHKVEKDKGPLNNIHL